MVGSTIEFVNKDPVAHDVYSYSVAKPFSDQVFQKQACIRNIQKISGWSNFE